MMHSYVILKQTNEHYNTKTHRDQIVVCQRWGMRMDKLVKVSYKSKLLVF